MYERKTVLFWLNLIAIKQTSVENIVRSHWARFGRHFYCRHDYEAIATDKANQLIQRLRDSVDELKGQSYAEYTIEHCDDFSYHDPVDGSITTQQGIRLIFSDGSRIVYRLSGTGTEGATLRVYIEKYEPDSAKHGQETQQALASLINIANNVAGIKEITGREQPDVIT